MKTQISFNRCSLCGCREYSVSVEALDKNGIPLHGFRLLGSAKSCRQVRVLDPDEPMYHDAYAKLISEPRAQGYVAATVKPIWPLRSPT